MRTFSIVTAVIAVILLIMPIIAVNSRFYGPLGKATDNVSLIPFASAISKANYQDRDKSKVFFDFFHSQMDGAAALISIPSKKEVFLMDGMYFFIKVDDYFRYFDENSVIYTDKLFPLMYNSSYENLSLMSFQRYDFQRLNAVGAVAYTGLKAYSTLADASEVKVKVLVPMNLRGQDLRLGVLLPTGGKPVPSLCRGVSAAFSDGRPLPESSFRGDQYVALIPKEEQREAFIEFTVSLPGAFPAETSPKGNDTGTTHCGFEFAGIGLNTLQ
jgi:hypothetical protein